MSGESIDWVNPQPTRVFDLEQPRFQGMPMAEAHQPGYLYVLHRRHNDTYDPPVAGVRSGASGVVVCMEHSGTHIDALCHQAESQTLYGGIDAVKAAGSRGFTQLGVETMAPIVARGVLLDIAGFRGVDLIPDQEAIGAAELAACREAEGVTINAGDVVLVRTGNDARWQDPESYLRSAGIHGSGSRWLGDLGVHAVGADNMAWDVEGLWDDETGANLAGHVELLVRRGIHIIENLMLAELAAGKHYTFTFICTPLKMTGATGSPVRPIAIV
jgi:kynurenine formamidase